MQYLRVHFNESLNTTKTTGSYCLENHHTCSKSHHLYITCSKCLPPARTQARRRWRHVANRLINNVIQTVRSFLMRRISSSTSEILVRTGVGHFEHVV